MKRYTVSLSGGKDSVATALYLRELEIPHRLLHADTEWEWAGHYEYMAYLQAKLGSIETVDGPGFEQVVKAHRMFPCRVRRFCTEELKVWPMQAAREEGEVTVLGVRAAESKARQRLPEHDTDRTGDAIWRPIIAWSVEDVWAILKRHGVEPHPLYAQGADRVGCWPCIFAGRKDLRLLEKLDPERVERVKQLEHEVQQLAWEGGSKAIGTFGTLRRPGSDRHEPVSFAERMKWAKANRGKYVPEEPTACLLEGLCG